MRPDPAGLPSSGAPLIAGAFAVGGASDHGGISPRLRAIAMCARCSAARERCEMGQPA
ncbi:hypothetical protein PSEUDO8Z_100400 [Pseudomonas sp. 8Z]|nr:hypothetical protein PSEUDO8Z_100400 [Pseudomonas sp. 8Z]